MKDIVYYNQLYDLYMELLTDKQKIYYECYYFDDLSLSEIAEKFNISRNAVFKQVQIVENKLKEFETKLELLKKKEELNNIIDLIDDVSIKNKLEELF